MWLILAAFLCGFAYDFVWSRCVDCVREHRALAAANLGIILYACTMISTLFVVDRFLVAIVAYGLGNWVGVYWAVRRKK
jgi:hypothetical protein